MDAELAVIDKRRSEDGTAEVMNVIGEVRGKRAIIVDDEIDTFGTMSQICRALEREGVIEMSACATHGVLSGPAADRIGSSPLNEVVVTDTVPLRDGAPDLITQLTCADILEDTIRRIFIDDSVSEIFAGENQLF